MQHYKKRTIIILSNFVCLERSQRANSTFDNFINRIACGGKISNVLNMQPNNILISNFMAEILDSSDF